MSTCCQLANAERIQGGCKSGHCCGDWADYVDNKMSGVMAGETARISGIDDNVISR